MPEGLAAVIII